MKSKDIESISHHGNHVVAPKAWREVPNCSGDYDLDATLLARKNKDLPARLNLYVTRRGTAYGPLTGYGAYHNYSGDT